MVQCPPGRLAGHVTAHHRLEPGFPEEERRVPLEDRMRTNRVFGALAVALLSSCADYGAPDEVLYGEAVFTQPAPGADFAGLAGTYYLDPTYTLVDGDDLSSVALPSSIRTAIENNMAALG